MADGDASEATLDGLRRRPGPSSNTPAATAGASAPWRRSRARGSTTAELERPLRRSPAASSPGRRWPGRSRPARPAAARRADQPPRHRVAGVARELPDRLDAAVVLVAHDRWFLESVGTSVLELEAGQARYFAGPWHAWREERAARELAAGRDVDKRQAEIARMERFVERFRYKATKARQAQSRVKMIEKLKRDGARPQRRGRRRAHARVLVRLGASAPGGSCWSWSTATVDGRRPHPDRRRGDVARAR